MHYWRLFQRLWLALRLTWQGKPVPRSTLALHWDWLEEAEKLLHEFSAALKQLPPEPNFRLRYEGKAMPPSTALNWLHFSFQRELPSLLRSGNPYAQAAFKALVWNLKDLLTVWQTTQINAEERTLNALNSLIKHLNSLPEKDER